MGVKILSNVGECPLVIVSTKGVTADHEKWIEQNRKQDIFNLTILFAVAPRVVRREETSVFASKDSLYIETVMSVYSHAQSLIFQSNIQSVYVYNDQRPLICNTSLLKLSDDK